MKFWLLLLPVVLSADPIVEPTPIVSTVCTVADALVPCGPASTVYGSERVGVFTRVSILGIGTADGLYIDAFASAEAGSIDWDSLGVGSSALATISLDFLGSTDGPARPGFANFAILTDHDWGVDGSSGSSGSIAGLENCGVRCEKYGTMVPFELGVPFEISLNLFASGGTGQHILSGGFAETIIVLQLFDGAEAVAIFDPPQAVPEPGTWGLVALGVLLCLFLRRHATRQLLRERQYRAFLSEEKL
jgi:PEP-CTERM motif